MPIRPLLIILGSLLFSFNLSAQIVCDFRADTTEACAPAQIQFTDISSGPRAIIYWSWDFGNSGFSNLQNPSRVYPNSGLYTIKLTVSDGIDTVTTTKTQYIKVFKGPGADFTLTTNGKCKPVLANFTDKTTIGDAPIKTYTWDYGDLTPPGSGRTTNHLYNFGGTYSAILTVIDTNGCVSTSSPQNVSVNAPKIAFTGSPRADCLPPLNVTYTNSTTGNGPFSYQWTFGDGGTSTSANPTHNYTTSGFFDVRLIVSDKDGCKDTLNRIKYISIGKTEAKFNVPQDTFCVGLSYKMSNTSTGAQSYFWDFGNSTTSSQREPSVRYTVPGTYTIKMKASSGPACQDSVTKVIYVEDIKAGFEVNYDSICNPNFVSFKDTSKGNISYSEYIVKLGSNGGEIKLIALDTFFTFPVSYCATRSYLVDHIVRTKNGCESKTTQVVRIFNDQLTGLVNSTSHCVPTVVSFSVSECLRFKAVKWHWNFGTGNPADTSNLKTPTNTFTLTSAGKYLASIEVTDSAGCKYKQNVPYEVGEKQKASFTMDDDTICYGETISFTNTSTDSTKITAYGWQFGDNTFSASRHDKHQYNQLGRMKITLSVWNNNCDDTTSQYAYVSGPVVGINPTPDCQNPLNQDLTGFGVGGYNRFYWDMGDGSPLDSINLRKIHTYSSKGAYNITFKAYNDTTGCVDSAVYTPDTIPVIAEIDSFPSQVCVNSFVSFDATPSKGNLQGRYFWDFGDGGKANFIRKPTYQFSKIGTYTVTLAVMSQDSCVDTTRRIIEVSGITPDFALPTNLCTEGDSITVKNLSKSFYSQVAYEWHVNRKLITKNDSMIYAFRVDSAKRDSTLILNTDTVEVLLKAEDTAGCKSQLRRTIYVHELKAQYELQDSTLCKGDQIIFSDPRLPSNADHTWFFGDGDSSKALEPRRTYDSSGVYISRYIVESNGCKDTAIIPITVQGIDSVQFDVSLRDTNCYPATIFFDDLSVGDSLTWRTWDFGDGIAPIRTPLKDSLTKTFLFPGLYTIKVTVETSNGCLDSATYSDYIHIKGPYSEFSIYPDSLCVGEPVTLVHDTSNPYVHKLIWDFADGRVDTTGTTVDSLNHKYYRTGSLLAILLMEDSAASCRKFFQRDVVIEDVHANFGYDPDSVGCMPYLAGFKDNSIDGNTWEWDFGDGDTSMAQDPKHTFEKDGKYQVTLQYSNSNNGCRDTMVREVRVLPLPTIETSGDTAICLGQVLQLNASGANVYSWSPTDNLDNPNIANPRSKPYETVTYRVTGMDTNTCVNTADLTVYVQQIPEIVMPENVEIIIGEGYMIKPNYTHGYSYRWQPSFALDCDTCDSTYAKPIESTQYTLFVKDSLGCFEVNKTFTIDVLPKFSVDMPEAFTPNGDSVNDKIGPNGWGIKNVLVFKVYNRWGELLFEADAQNPEWDGYYKGELQNMETYVYYVEAISYSGEVKSIEGYFSLVR